MTEQRYGYTYHRVLIDSTRVLDPQFDDAVIYVTGAQLELLRNVTQYLNRLSTYVSEYHPDYYLSPTIEDYDSICAIVADLESVLMGNPNTIWGYADRWHEYRPSESVGDTHTYANSNPVPAGQVFVLELFNIYHLGGTPCAMSIGIGAFGTAPLIYEAPAVPSGDVVYQQVNMTLKEGDYVTHDIIGLPSGEVARMRLWGHKMVVPE